MSRPTIAALVLAHLATSPLLACKRDEPPRMPEPEPVATSTPIASESAQPPPTPTTATPATQATQVGKKCKVPKDCQPPLQCALGTDGHRLIPGSGTCVEPGPRPGGRPLMVGGSARVATSIESHEWGDGAAPASTHRDDAIEVIDEAARGAMREQLLRDALDEHASVASFARTMCQLIALGAPAWLVEKTQRALADEIVHAKKTLAWVKRLGGGMGPGRLPEAVAPFPAFGDGEALAKDLLRDVMRGGCVGETLAAHEMAERSVNAPLADLRALYTDLARDEARHAALAYETALWLVTTFPSLAPVIAEEQAHLLAEVSEADRSLLAPLLAVLDNPRPAEEWWKARWLR